MVEEKKNDGVDDPISLLLEQALTRQRDKMMENFSHILQCLSIASGTSSSSGHFGGTSPFKVQVNFYIPVFEGVSDNSCIGAFSYLILGLWCKTHRGGVLKPVRRDLFRGHNNK